MLSIINVLTGMKNITLNETANLIYTHRDKKNPDGFSSFKVEVSNPLLYTPVEDLSKSDIKLYSYTVSEFNPEKDCECVQLCNAVSFFESKRNFLGHRKKGGFQFQLKDAESNKRLMDKLRKARKFGNLVFFRITGLPSKDPTQAPTTADCSNVYGTEESYRAKRKKLVTQDAKTYRIPQNSESTAYNGVHEQKGGTENTEPPLKVPIKGEMPVSTSNPGATENSKPPVKPDGDENSKPPVRLDEDENSKPPVKPDGDENSKPPVRLEEDEKPKPPVKPDGDENSKLPVKPEVNQDSTPPVKPEVNQDSKPPVKAEENEDSKPPVKPEVNEDSNPPVKPEVNGDSKPPVKPEVNEDSKPPVKPEVNEDSRPPVNPEVNEDPKPPVSTDILEGDENTVNHDATDVLGSNSTTGPPSERNFFQKYKNYLLCLAFGVLVILFTLWALSKRNSEES